MEEYGNHYQDPYATHYERPDGIKRFFFACAGAYLRILEECPSEHTKYVGIGATIFLTACLAVISGSFAIYTLVQSIPIAIMFGLLWGALIFNLDRYIVSSIRKEGRFWNELAIAAPRLIFAILISIVITKPIELEIFRNQINTELLSYTTDLQKDAVAQLDSRLGLDSIRQELKAVDSVRLEFKKLREGKPTSFDFGEISAEYTAAKVSYDSLYKVYNPRIKANDQRRSYLWGKYAKRIYEEDENGVRRATGKWDVPKNIQEQTNNLYLVNKRLKGELETQSKLVQELEQKRRGAREEFADGMEKEITLLNEKRTSLVASMQEKEAIRREELPNVEETAKKYGIGLPGLIQALERMKKADSSIWWTSNLIMLLFILIETSPVFVKLISKRGPYDYLLNRIEHSKKVESLRYISDINYDLNNSMRLQARQKTLNGVQHEEQMYSDN
ncbi:MAG: DUF4407 domain-containing protein [Bacteroidota bacterium]